jgi:tetratricopeptide (TPR) repeat protein
VLFRFGILVASLGGFTSWLVHTSVDWMSLMPGMTGMALCGAAVLTAYDGTHVESPWLPRTLAAVGVVLVLLGAVFLGRETIAERLKLDGEAQLASNPTQALHEAQRSLAYNGASVPARYVESAAYERLGDYARSRGALLAAIKQEPSDWVTWVLLGELTARHGDLRTATADYHRAVDLNPRIGA